MSVEQRSATDAGLAAARGKAVSAPVGEAATVDASLELPVGVASEPVTIVGPDPARDSAPRPIAPGDHLSALRNAEIVRSRVFFQYVLWLAMALAPSVFLLDGNATARWAFIAALFAYVAVTVPCWWTLRRGAVPGDALLFTSGAAGMTAAYVGLCFFGVFSLGLMVVVLALYFFSLAGNTRLTRWVYGVAAVEHAALSSLVIAGVIPDVGLIQPLTSDVLGQALIQAFAAAILLLTYVLASQSRAANEEVFLGLERAVGVIVARQEAVLAEAEQELARARATDGTGRFTGQKLGAFTLGPVIGRGAMGEIYAATSSSDHDGRYAVKVLRNDMLSLPQAVRRFLREGELLRCIQSEHVVAVVEVGGEEQRLPYIAMRRMRGRDLGTLLRTQGTMGATELCELARQVAAGLTAAHTAGIIHRDLKPQNIVCDESASPPVWRIVDFGAARATSGPDELTRGQVIGTPAYMAPEQAEDRPVDARADVYALAAVLYRAATGEPLFVGTALTQLLLAAARDMPQQPSTRCSLNPAVDAVLAIGLAKNPADRFDSADELADAFVRATAGQIAPDHRRRAEELLAQRPWGAAGP